MDGKNVYVHVIIVKVYGMQAFYMNKICEEKFKPAWKTPMRHHCERDHHC